MPIQRSHPCHKLTGVLAKQVCPLGQPAPLGQSIAHELTASFHDVPQKFPLACTTTGIVANAAAATDARDDMFSFMVLYLIGLHTVTMFLEADRRVVYVTISP